MRRTKPHGSPAVRKTHGVEGERLWTRDLVFVLAGVFLLFTNTTGLVSVLPVVAGESGGSSAAGLVTGCFYFPAVATQLQMPWVMNRVRARWVLVAAFSLLGLPCVFYAIAPGSLALVLATTAVRGIGFGIATVAVGTLAAQLAPPARRGTVLGVSGLLAGIPPVFAPAMGLWLLDGVGAKAAFLAAGAVGVVGAVLSLALHSRPAAGRPRPEGLLRAIVGPALRWPFSWFLIVSLTRGAAVSFVPLWLIHGGWASASTYLLVFGTLAYLARWGGGRLVDRYGARRLVVPGAVSSLAGLVLLASGNHAGGAVVAAGLLFGLGYGLLATSSQLDMLSRWSTDSFAVPTTAWNIAIDFGVGLGGVFVGLVASIGGYSAAFWVLPVAMAFVLALILLEPHPERHGGAVST